MSLGSNLSVGFDNHVYVLDVGCFTETGLHVAAISGSDILVLALPSEGVEWPAKVKAPRLTGSLKLLWDRLAPMEPSCLHHVRVGPFRAGEPAKELLTAKGKLAVFIGDTHMCLRDGGDPFSTNRSTVLASRLNAVVSVAKQIGGVVYQTGDFVDVWMAEPLNMFRWEGKEVVDRSKGRTAQRKVVSLIQRGYKVVATDTVAGKRIQTLSKPILNTPQERVDATVQSLRRAWTGEANLLSLCSKVDRFLLGNHDWDLVFASQAFWHGRTFGLRDQGPILGGHVSARIEHGHAYDAYNSTAGANSIADVDKLEGKSLTWQFAQNRRGLPWSRPDGAGVGGWKEWGQTFLSNPPPWWSPGGLAGLVEPEVVTLARRKGAVQLADFIDGMMGVHPTTRAGVAEAIRKELLERNGGWPGYLDGKDRKRSTYKLCDRLWIHGHTHQPTVRRFDVTRFASFLNDANWEDQLKVPPNVEDPEWMLEPHR